MNRDDIAEVLAAVRLFRGADPALIKTIAQQPRARRRTKADEPVYEAGDPADAIFVAFPTDAAAIGPRGIVELLLPVGDAGLPGHVEHVVAGEAFGEFEFVAAGLALGKYVRRSAARTLLPCDLYRIPLALLAPALAEAEAIRGRLVRLSMERLLAALNVKATHALGDRDIALANWLIDAADNVGIAEGRHVRFSRAIGQSEIARTLGVSRETISLRLNEWERAGLLNTGGQSQRFEILDYPRVALRAAVRKDDAPAAIAAALDEIDADLNHGDLVRARNVALDMLTFFPASPDLRHRVALAAMRAGAVREAVDVLARSGYATGGDMDLLAERVRVGLAHPGVAPARLFFSGAEADDGNGEPDEEAAARLPALVEDIAAIEARARKEMAFASDAAGGRQKHAAISAHLYQTVFAATAGTYAGINAAMMSSVAGNDKQAAALARKMLATLGEAPKGYWAGATLGEAHLLLGDEAAARAAFDAAAAAPDASDGKRSSTRLQVSRIGKHRGIAVAGIMEALPVGGVAVYCGRSFGDLDGAAQAEREESLGPRIAAALAADHIRYVYGSLAGGADILIAEAALAAGCDLHVVLPFSAESFVDVAVAAANPPDGPDRWGERFRTCLDRSTSLTTAIDLAAPKRALDAHLHHGFRLAAGLALMHADALTAAAIMLAASDGRVASNLPGMAQAMGEWTAAGRKLVAIPTAPGGEGAAAWGPDVFAPVVFLWPVEPAADIAALCQAAAERTGHDATLLARTSRDRRTGAAMVMPDIKAALDMMAALADLCRDSAAPVRLIADFGPVRDARGQTSETALSRLAGASDLIGFPTAVPIATMAFAAEARLDGDGQVALIPIGRTASGPAAEGRHLAARAVYALSFPGSDALSALATVAPA